MTFESRRSSAHSPTHESKVATTSVETLDATVKRITTLVQHYRRDAPFRAPETVPEWQARLLNDVWTALTEAQGC
jgi:hypothetical protein